MAFDLSLSFVSLAAYCRPSSVVVAVESGWSAIAKNRESIAINTEARKERFQRIRTRLTSFKVTDWEEKRQNILQLKLLELRDALESEEISAVEALNAYLWKALEVHEKFNCAAEFLIQAFDEAEVLDKEWRGKHPKPPLFGVPFSVKGNFYLENYDCTIGLAKFLFQPKRFDCTFITHLRSLGAVPFVSTNVPQALLSFVCSNEVYGTTGNFHNVDRTPGGSSGGESVLCAAGGAAFGTGSDLAGSLRIPASFCGVVTLKPTEARFVVQKGFPGLPGKGRMALSHGYFTRSVEEQIYLLKHTFGVESYTKLVPNSAPLPLNEERIDKTRQKKLRIGYYKDDNFLKAVPACSRVVIETVEKLKKLGHELVLYDMCDGKEAAELFFKNIVPDQGAFINSLYKDEPLSPYIKTFAILLKIPLIIRWLVGNLLKWFSPELSTVSLSYVRSLSDLRHTQEKTDDYTEKFMAQWTSMNLDAIICPAFPVPAIPHIYPSQLNFCAFATGLYNMLDFPCGVVPTGSVTKEDDDALADESQWPVGNNPVLKKLREAASNSSGMPLAVQIVALPFHEEECLAVMEIIEKLWQSNRT